MTRGRPSGSSASTAGRRDAARASATRRAARSPRPPAPPPTSMSISPRAVAVMRARRRRGAGKSRARRRGRDRASRSASVSPASTTRTDAERVVAAFPGYARVAAPPTTPRPPASAPMPGADGGLVIAGTGSAAIARVAGRETIVGGRGFALGDDGSGAHIGLDALRAATRAHDGLGPESAAHPRNSRQSSAATSSRWSAGRATAKPGDYGAFAPLVFDRAAERRPGRARDRREGGARDRRARAPRGGARRRARRAGRRRRRSLASLSRARRRRAPDAAPARRDRRGHPDGGRPGRDGEGSLVMKVFFGARLFDGERFLDDHALVVEDGAIRALVDVDGAAARRRADRLRRRDSRARPDRLADQRRRRRAVQRRADRRGDRAHRPRPPARGRDGLPADRRHRRARGARRRRSPRPARRRRSVPGALGIHVEGPFIDPRRPGIHPPQWIRPMRDADAEALIAARAGAMVVTLAPASRSARRSSRGSRERGSSSASAIRRRRPRRRRPCSTPARGRRPISSTP